MNTITAIAHPNIASIKYWGKLNQERNIPATGSLSLTLDGFFTQTSVTLTSASNDSFFLNDQEQTNLSHARVVKVLDAIRQRASKNQKCMVKSYNSMPTASGLASSASGFAALACAATHAFGLPPNLDTLSSIACLGSASAARSLLGGFVLMHPPSSSQSLVKIEEVTPHPTLSLAMVVAQCGDVQKSVSSRQGMLHTEQTSPYYDAWLRTHADDLTTATLALREGDFDTLGSRMEHSTLKMHACALAARPGLWYMAPATLALMNRVRELRASGTPCFFTMDAGPHVKVLCHTKDAPQIQQELNGVCGVSHVFIMGPGVNARIIKEKIV